MKKVTIKDVAREAGVSITTVSHSLSGGGVISQATREHVIEVAKRMQYVPDLNGKNLKSKSTKVIGLFVTSLRGNYYGVLADTMYWEGKQQGYDLNIFITDQNMKMMTDILGGRIDGAIILNQHITQENVETLIHQEVPTVFLDREVSGEYMASIVLDSYMEGKMAGEYLISLGHRKIGYMQGVHDNYDNRERYRGFTDALNAAGLTLEPYYIWEGWFEQQASHDAMVGFIKEGKHPLPDAIFTANDLSAYGCIEGLSEMGYNVPGDISVIGCDDSELSKWFSPPLTTVKTSFEKQGIMAIHKILDLIEKRETGNVQKISSAIVERASCRKKE